MKKNTKAFSLIIAIGLMAASIMVAYIIMEYMIPFLRNIKGVENSAASYYFAYSGLEKGLYFVSTRSSEKEETSTDIYSGTEKNYGYEYKTFSSGTVLPKPGTGNSEYDQNYNTISMGNPIQLSIGYGYITNISGLKIFFRVPEINSLRDTLTSNENIINWQLSSETQTLNSVSGSLIKASEINNSGIKMSDKNGRLIDGSSQNFGEFYSNYCGSSNRCILRFSIINPLKGKNANIPYLEWKITSSPSLLPLRYSRIESTGKAYGFSRDLEIRVPQDTVPEALDFTVFQ